MLRRTAGATISKAVRVLLSCTVLVMFSAMLRIYQDPEAPHDMYPGLESCRQIKDLARHKFDGEYLIRSEMVAQIAALWSQSDCWMYAGLLSNSQAHARVGASQEQRGTGKDTSGSAPRRSHHGGPSFDSADASEDFTGSAAYNPALAGDLPIASHGGLTSWHAPAIPPVSSRADDVPSPPPRSPA